VEARKDKSPASSKLANTPQHDLVNLKKRDCIVGDPEDFVHLDWTSEWTELKNLGSWPEDLDIKNNG
jgi:hypothetical protein